MVTGIVVKVRNLMNKDFISVDVNASVIEAIKAMTDHDIGSVVITRNDVPEGILTERDCLKGVCGKLDCSVTSVGDIMSTPLITIDADASLYEAASQMLDNNIRRLLVTNEGTIIGIFTQKDLLTKINEVFLALVSI